MKPAYIDWIKTVVEPTGRCAEVTLEMQAAFPELTRVRGHYYCPFWGEREHWWLVDEEGQVVDPTAAQFPSRGVGHYEPWDESRPEPTGMCPECGEYCYEGRTFCCDVHERRYMAYLQTGIL